MPAPFIPITALSGTPAPHPPERVDQADAGPGSAFVEQLREFVQDVDAAQQAAGHKVTEFTEGRDHDLHGTMILMEQAGIKLRLMTTVRNKVIEAYREVMRMGA